MKALPADRRSAIETLLGDRGCFTAIENERGFYLATIEFSKNGPNVKEAERELKRIGKRTAKAHVAVRDLVREFDRSTATVRLAMKRQSTTDAEQVIRAALSRLTELVNPVYPHPRKIGGERSQWERENFIWRLVKIFESTTDTAAGRTMKESIYRTKLFDFIKAGAGDLTGFKGEGDTALTSAVRRALESLGKN